MTLHDRIRAVVEERLRIARAAHPGPWEWSDRGWQGRLTADAPDFHRIVTVDQNTAEASWSDFAFMSQNGPDDAILSAEHALGILERHAPRTDHAGRLECELCDSLCHSGSGLGCDTPDAPWPCEEIISLATRWRVEVDG